MDKCTFVQMSTTLTQAHLAAEMNSSDVLLVIGILDQVDGDLVAGHIGAARTRIRCLQSSLLKQADLLRARESYRARSENVP
jgi:hypothetical protein